VLQLALTVGITAALASVGDSNMPALCSYTNHNPPILMPTVQSFSQSSSPHAQLPIILPILQFSCPQSNLSHNSPVLMPTIQSFSQSPIPHAHSPIVLPIPQFSFPHPILVPNLQSFNPQSNRPPSPPNLIFTNILEWLILGSSRYLSVIFAILLDPCWWDL